MISLLGNNIWIGLYDSLANSPTRNFLWSDGTKVKYTNWNKNEPNNEGGNEDCVELYTYVSYMEKICIRLKV